MASERVKYALRSFAYNIIDIDDRHFHTDSKRVKLIKSLRKRFVILKPDKGQGIVLLKKEDYVPSLENIFSNKRKFKEIEEDPMIRRVETIKTYINTMFKRDYGRREEVDAYKRSKQSSSAWSPKDSQTIRQNSAFSSHCRHHEHSIQWYWFLPEESTIPADNERLLDERHLPSGRRNKEN